MARMTVQGKGEVEAPEVFAGACAASTGARVMAKLFDALIGVVFIIAANVSVALGGGQDGGLVDRLGFVAFILMILTFVWCLVQPLLLWVTGQTVGMKIGGVRWVSLASGKTKFGSNFLKMLFEGFVPFAPIFMLATQDHLGRTMFDRWAGTIVLNIRQGRDTHTTPAPAAQPQAAPAPGAQPWQAQAQTERPSVLSTPAPVGSQKVSQPTAPTPRPAAGVITEVPGAGSPAKPGAPVPPPGMQAAPRPGAPLPPPGAPVPPAPRPGAPLPPPETPATPASVRPEGMQGAPKPAVPGQPGAPIAAPGTAPGMPMPQRSAPSAPPSPATAAQPPAPPASGGFAPPAQPSTPLPPAPMPPVPATQPSVPPTPATPVPPVPAAAPVPPAPIAVPSPTNDVNPTVPAPAPAQPEEDLERTIARRPAASIKLSFDDGTHHFLVGQALIGRAPQADDEHKDAHLIAISDPERSISKNHIAVSVQSGAVLVEDLNSLNGTTVVTSEGSTMAVLPGKPVMAAIGSTIHYGDRSVKIGD